MTRVSTSWNVWFDGLTISGPIDRTFVLSLSKDKRVPKKH